MNRSKKYKNGLVLGSFEPFHFGHKFLIDTAINNSEKVHVLVCYRDNDEINGEFRYESIRYTYSNNPNVIIYNIKHNYDDYPGEFGTTKDEFYDLWVNKIVYNNVKDLDVIFTSEDYGDEFAKYLNIEHFLVDKQRIKYNISGTEIRNYPYKNWKYLPDVTKNYFIKKIVLVGPESSGKTTMAKLISKKLNTTYIKEYGADYIDQKGLNQNTKNNDKFSIIDINHIASGQIHLENEALKQNNKTIIYDTDLITTQIWSEIYFNKCPKWIVDESYRRTYDLYLLMDIDFEWQDEGIREFPEKRQWHFNRIKKELDKRNLNYKLISGTIEDRLKKCLKEIKKL